MPEIKKLGEEEMGRIALALLRRRFRRSPIPTGPENLALVRELVSAKVAEADAVTFLSQMNSEEAPA